jgi:hypothetical protein
MDDDLVAQFSAITDTDASKAAAYLRLTDGNMEQAVQLYFEDPNLAADAPAAGPSQPPTRQPAAQPAPRARRYAEDEDGVVHIPDDSDEDDLDLDMDDADDTAQPPPAPASGPSSYSPAVEDDEAMARRLQEEMYQAAGRDPEGVRAPIGRKTQTLVGGGDDYDDVDVHAMLQHQMAARQARRNQAGRKSNLQELPF